MAVLLGRQKVLRSLELALTSCRKQQQLQGAALESFGVARLSSLSEQEQAACSSRDHLSQGPVEYNDVEASHQARLESGAQASIAPSFAGESLDSFWCEGDGGNKFMAVGGAVLRTSTSSRDATWAVLDTRLKTALHTPLLIHTRAYQSVSAPAREERPNWNQQTGGVCAFVKNLPHNLFASDLLRYFAEFGGNVHPMYLDKFRFIGWYVEFPSREAYNSAVRKTARQTLGARPLRLEERSQRSMEADLRMGQYLKDWRGRSVIVTHLPSEVSDAEIERFFHGYSIAGNGIMIVKANLEKRGADDKTEPVVEVKAAIKFTTGLEALRAWREKHLEIMNKRSVRIALMK